MNLYQIESHILSLKTLHDILNIFMKYKLCNIDKNKKN